MEIIKSSKPLALYIHPGYDSLIFVARALGAAGFSPIITTYDSNISEICDLSNVDIIVFDQLHEREDLKHCSKLRTDEHAKNTPIIVIVDNDNITQNQVISSGANKYLKMPLDIMLFMEDIKAYLHK